MNSVMVDTKLKNKIESMNEYNKGVCSIKFKDMDDTFWFNTKSELQEFLNKQSVERFWDKELRKGYFDYINDCGDTLRYFVEVVRGKVTSYRDVVVER